MNKFLKISAIFFTILVVVLSSTLEFTNDALPIDNIVEINHFSKSSNDSILYLGFSKKSIVPKESVPLAGYSIRNKFEGVNDSIYVRTLLFKQNNQITAVISYDLMLVTPTIVDLVKEEASNLGIDNFYFSATHSHSSIGGYGEGFLGKLILGGQNEGIVQLLKNTTIECLKNSIENSAIVLSINYYEQSYNKVKNRLTKERDIIQKMRNVKFELENDKEVKLVSTNAHPTIISHNSTKVSGDYPSMFCKRDSSDFTIFVAGTMGSYTPIIHNGKNSFEKADNYAKLLLNSPITISDTLSKYNFSYSNIYIDELDYGFQIAEFIKVRQWFFEFLIKKLNPKIDVIRLGKLLFISLPIELSGEYYDELSRLALSKDYHLILTTFNGSYLGYGTPSIHFHINHMETREMNWLGKYGGDYFYDIITKIIEKQ